MFSNGKIPVTSIRQRNAVWEVGNRYLCLKICSAPGDVIKDILVFKMCLFSSKDVCRDMAPSLLLGDVPEAAVSSGEGKRKE